MCVLVAWSIFIPLSASFWPPSQFTKFLSSCNNSTFQILLEFIFNGTHDSMPYSGSNVQYAFPKLLLWPIAIFTEKRSSGHVCSDFYCMSTILLIQIHSKKFQGTYRMLACILKVAWFLLVIQCSYNPF